VSAPPQALGNVGSNRPEMHETRDGCLAERGRQERAFYIPPEFYRITRCSGSGSGGVVGTSAITAPRGAGIRSTIVQVRTLRDRRAQHNPCRFSKMHHPTQSDEIGKTK